MAYTVGQSGVANWANTALSSVTRVVADGGLGAGGVTIIATSPFTPGNAVRTTSGIFAVPTGTTNLVIEIWGGGGGGGSGFSGTSGPEVSGTPGADSTIISPSMRAKGGGKGYRGGWSYYCYCCNTTNGAPGGSGGTLPSGSTGPSGSVIALNVQVNGSDGGDNYLINNGDAHGGAGHNGFVGLGGLAGIGGAQVAITQNGIDATNYAAGGSGSGGSNTGGFNPPDAGGSGGGGGCAGGYVRYTMTSGIPSSITFTVGAKGTGDNFGGTFPPAGNGSNGVVRFTYS